MTTQASTHRSARPLASAGRLWEIDAARGTTVVLMIVFHLTWDLQFLGLSTVNVFSPPWQAFARGIGSSFAFLMGLSLVLVDARLRHRATLWRYALRRGAMIFGLGMLVTLATYVALSDQFVRFGILHMLGVMLIVAVPFVSLEVWRIVTAGLILVVLGVLFSEPSYHIHARWLLPLGLPPADVEMADYYPLLPWGGAVFFGVAFGKWAYQDGERRFRLADISTTSIVRGLCLLGRHSLLVYLVHQPILLAALFAVRAVFAYGAP